MKLTRIGKVAVLGGFLMLTLLLSSCYVAPDEITDNTQNMATGGPTRLFDTYAPTATVTPSPTPAPTTVVIGNETVNPTINTGDGWSQGIATNTPPPVNVNTPVVATNVPAGPVTTAKTTTATPTPTPASSVLKKGSSGTRVKQLQERLKALGYYTGSIDGDYGDGTVTAVKNFQKANGLKADGTVGTETMTKLYSNSAKPYSGTVTTKTTAKKTAAKTTPKKTATPRPTATPNLNKLGYLKDGASGKSVKTLQQRLIDLGWMAGAADGNFGAATEEAVRAFQKKTSGLYADGIAGPETQKALYSASAKKTSTPASVGGQTLRPGSEGLAVRVLQKRLKTLGYYKGSVDGSYGTATQEAVRNFQDMNGLTGDGIAGVSTLNQLYSPDVIDAKGMGDKSDAGGTKTTGNKTTTNSTNTKVTGSSLPVTSVKTTTGYTTQKSGDKGSSVTAIQQRLKELGYYNKSVDGKYGQSTKDAVSAFQRVNNLRVDGIAGPATQRKLFNYTSKTKYSTLHPGDVSGEVSALQQTLYELGYYDGKVTGTYDDLTEAAVREFQQINNLDKVDGIAGNNTLQTLYSAKAAGATTENTNFKTLRSGAKGEEVVELQDMLRSLGYLEELTGVYDKATVNAVKLFQKNNHLTADGIAGAATQKLLYSGNPVPNY